MSGNSYASSNTFVGERVQKCERGSDMNCKHCGQPISDDRWPVHEAGNYRGKSRCDPDDSDLPYGFNAGRYYEDCESPCLGAS